MTEIFVIKAVYKNGDGGRYLESCAGGKWGYVWGWLPMTRRHLEWITWSLEVVGGACGAPDRY